MNESYTQQACSHIFDLVERELAGIWADIEATPADTTAELWKKKLSKIAQDYALSSRFALMRLFCARAAGINLAAPESGCLPSGAGFEATVQGKTVSFRDISLSHADSLSHEEDQAYIAFLMDQADRQADSDPEVNAYIISRAWYDEESANSAAEQNLPEEIRADSAALKKMRSAFTKENRRKYRTRLTREEALQLGHILGLTLEEMQWYLMRVFDSGDSLRFNQSADLIHAYGYLTQSSWQQVEQLKEDYRRTCAHIPKAELPGRDRSWTRDISGSLPGMVTQWKRFPETMDQEFLDWMRSRAPGLDVPSRSGRRVYRNLAVFAYDLLTGEQIIPDEQDFTDCILDVCAEAGESGAVLRELYRDGSICPRRCKEVSDALLLANKVQSSSLQEDNTKAWHILSTLDDGSLTASGGVVNSSRSRITDILRGELQAEKGDLLYLLWFTANLIWQVFDAKDTDTICCRVMDLMDSARDVLDAAGLPPFYPPHPMEQSMLLSIVYGGKEQEDASIVYEYMLYALTRRRQKKEGAKRHDAQFKLDAVAFYRSHRELGLRECAAQLNVSPQSLSLWQKQLVDKGLI